MRRRDSTRLQGIAYHGERMEPVSKPVPGSLLGERFRVLSLLGEGGMGAVYEAENIATHKRVAIKWLGYSAEAPTDAAQRLLQEARAAGRVRHPNVVDIYDVGREGDVIFLVMELLEGESLRALLERGGAQMQEVVGLLMRAMRGVAAAHRAGVIHRDVKPENIFLARVAEVPEPVPKVLDFGISKLAAADELTSTRTGTVIGTPMYMSYEQLTGRRDIDARVDVYAFGVVLYEALTGRPPFHADTVTEWSIKLATSEPLPPSAHCDGIPPALDDVVLRAMARSREQRTPDLETLLRELEPFSTPRGFSPAPTASALSARPSDRAPAITRRVPRSGAEEPGQPIARPSAQAPTHAPPSSSMGARKLPWLMAAGAIALTGAVSLMQLPRGADSSRDPIDAVAPLPTASEPTTSEQATAPTLPAWALRAGHADAAEAGALLSDAGPASPSRPAELAPRSPGHAREAPDSTRAPDATSRPRLRYRASKLRREDF
jgi:serine/threonine protein kinase